MGIMSDIADRTGDSNFDMFAQLDRIEAKLDQLLAKKKPAKPRLSKAEYPDWFKKLWSAYPKRAGNNPKKSAYSKAKARLDENKDGLYWFELLKGTQRYKRYCRATEKIDTEYVLQAATFFGTDKGYEKDWTIPKKKPSEDPDKQYHKTFDPDAKVVIPDGINPYEDM